MLIAGLNSMNQVGEGAIKYIKWIKITVSTQEMLTLEDLGKAKLIVISVSFSHRTGTFFTALVKLSQTFQGPRNHRQVLAIM